MYDQLTESDLKKIEEEIEYRKLVVRKEAIEAVKEALANGKNVVLEDDPANNVYPMPALHAGSFDTFVGRVRRDATVADDRGVAMWVVADQLLRGAALNAVYIAQALLPQA